MGYYPFAAGRRRTMSELFVGMNIAMIHPVARRWLPLSREPPLTRSDASTKARVL